MTQREAAHGGIQGFERPLGGSNRRVGFLPRLGAARQMPRTNAEKSDSGRAMTPSDAKGRRGGRARRLQVIPEIGPVLVFNAIVSALISKRLLCGIPEVPVMSRFEQFQKSPADSGRAVREASEIPAGNMCGKIDRLPGPPLAGFHGAALQFVTPAHCELEPSGSEIASR